MSNAERQESFSVEQYLVLEEQTLTKSEYIEGWIRAMSGSTLRHNKIACNCLATLAIHLQ